MEKRKLALLVALSLLLVALASLTATVAWEVLGTGYEAAGDGVSLVVLLAFLTYADAELVLFLREKFEGEKKESIGRKVVLIYLILLMLLILFAIVYFGANRCADENVDSLREDGKTSIPPEMEEEILLPQFDLTEEVETNVLPEEEREVPPHAEDWVDDMEEEKSIIEEEMIDIKDIPSSPTVNTTGSHVYDVLPPLMPSLSVKSSELREIAVPSVPSFAYDPFSYLEEEEMSEEDFWATFYIAGEDELALSDGLYFMDLYVNNVSVGTITVNVVNEELFLLSSELKSYISGTVTDEFESRLFANTSEYISLEYLESLGVETSYDAITYEVRLNFQPSDMPIQILSIGGTSAFRRARRPISGGLDLTPAVFTLASSYYLNARINNFLAERPMNEMYLSFSSSNTARLYDLYLDFSYYMNLTPFSLRAYLGSYVFHYDFPDDLIRLSWGNVSSDLFSPRGTSVGVRFDRSYSYAPSGYRRPSQIEEVIVVDKPSELLIYNEGREIFRRTLDVGTYRLRDFILYSGANRITIVLDPLDGADEKQLDLDIIYSSSLLAPGEVYYGASLVTGRSIVSSNYESLNGSFKLPLFNDRSLVYDLRDIVLSGYLRAGITETLTVDTTLALQNSPTNLSALRPNMKIATELTNANILGTTRFGLNITERTADDGTWKIPGIYMNIGHQIRTDWQGLSGISLAANYSSPEESGVERRHRIGLSTSLSGRLGFINWSLSGSGGIYTDKIENSNWSLSSSLSLSASSNLWLSASMSIGGAVNENPRINGRIYATLRYDGGSLNASYGNSSSSLSARYSKGRHSLSASVDARDDLSMFNEYSFDASYAYSGDYIGLDFSVNATDAFSRAGASISMRTASLFADGLFTFSSYIPSNYVLISQGGALRGNTISIGSAGYSQMNEVPKVFGISMYDGISTSNSDSFIVYSQGKDSFSDSSSWAVNIPASTRSGYTLRLSAENKYASSALVILPDGTPWINGSSPIYRIIDSEGGKEIEMTDYYLFTDGDGRFVTSAMEVGEYAFDLPYDGGWILVRFTVLDRPEDLGLLQMLSQSNLIPAELDADIYTYEMNLSFDGVMSQDAFFEMIYGEVAS